TSILTVSSSTTSSFCVWLCRTDSSAPNLSRSTFGLGLASGSTEIVLSPESTVDALSIIKVTAPSAVAHDMFL
ncbi:hypothetical protein PFISCL1PPCAC_21146, partial [Pristionchus fissidentatus]